MFSNTEGNRSSRLPFIICCILSIYGFFITMQSPANPVSQGLIYSDGSIYEYIGHMIQLGKMPYADAFDHKGPVLYLINFLAVTISKKWGIWFIDLLFMCPILIFSYLTARKFISDIWALLLCVFLYADFWIGYTMGDMPDYYAALFDAAVIFLLADYYLTEDLSKKKLLIIGLCLAMGFWLKQTTIASAALLCAPILFHLLLSRDYARCIRFCLWAFIGFLIPSVLVCLWLWANGALDEMIRYYFIFSFTYVDEFDKALDKANSALFFFRFSSIAVMLTFYAAYFCSKFKSTPTIAISPVTDRIVLHGTFSALLTMAVVILPGRPYAHYNLMTYPLFVLIAAAIAHDFVRAEIPYLPVYKFISVILLGYLVLCPNLVKTMKYASSNWAKNPEDGQIVTAIRNTCEPGDKIAVATTGHCRYYLETGTESATTSPYIQATFFWKPEFCEDYRRQIKENQAKIIVWQDDKDIRVVFKDMDVINNYHKLFSTEHYSVFQRFDDSCLAWMTGLHQMNDPVSYLKRLNLLSDVEELTVLISVRDIPGHFLSEGIAEQLVQMGFSNAETLCDRQYHSFIGVHSPSAVYESIKDTADSYSTSVNGVPVEIRSSVFNAGNTSSILVNGDEYSPNRRGLNIVVLTKDQRVADAVSFDTHVPELTCIR